MSNQSIVERLSSLREVQEIWRGPAGYGIVCEGQAHAEVTARLRNTSYDYVLVTDPTELDESRSTESVFYREPGLPAGTREGAPSKWLGEDMTVRGPRPRAAADDDELTPSRVAGCPVVDVLRVDNAYHWICRVVTNEELERVASRVNAHARRVGAKIMVSPEWLFPPSRLHLVPPVLRRVSNRLRALYGRMSGVRSIWMTPGRTRVYVWLEAPEVVAAVSAVREHDARDGGWYQLVLLVPMGMQQLSAVPPEAICIANTHSMIHGFCRWCADMLAPENMGGPCPKCGARALPDFAMKVNGTTLVRMDVYINPDTTAYVEAVYPDAAGQAGPLSQTLRWTLPAAAVFEALPFGRNLEAVPSALSQELAGARTIFEHIEPLDGDLSPIAPISPVPPPRTPTEQARLFEQTRRAAGRLPARYRQEHGLPLRQTHGRDPDAEGSEPAAAEQPAAPSEAAPAAPSEAAPAADDEGGTDG